MVNSSTKQMAEIKVFSKVFPQEVTEQSAMCELLEVQFSGLSVAHPGIPSSPLPILCLWVTRSTSVTRRADQFKQPIDTGYKNQSHWACQQSLDFTEAE